MKTLQKVVAFFLLFTLIISVFGLPAFAETKFINHENWIEVSASTITTKYNNGQKFVVMFFRQTCFNSNLRKTIVKDWLDDYDLTVYGVDVDKYSFPYWALPNLSGQIGLPVISFIDGKSVVSYSSDTGMREIAAKLHEFLGITDPGEYDFSKFNRETFGKYANTPAEFPEETAALSSDIIDQALDICRGKTSQMDKLRAIYDWVTENIYYDFGMLDGTTPRNVSADYTLFYKSSVCEGYSNLTAALCLAAGIPCRVVTGFASGVGSDEAVSLVWNKYKDYLKTGNRDAFISAVSMYENHAWNEAFVGGRWVILDTTWGSNNERYPSSGIISGTPSSEWFDPDFSKFSETHVFWHDHDQCEKGHTRGKAVRENEKAASCTSGGYYDEVVYCSVCKKELSREKKTVPALGHNYTEYVSKPTCTAKGYTRHKCSRCGDNYVDTYVNAYGHSFGDWNVKTAATCTAGGTEERTCSVCKFVETRVISATGHTPRKAVRENEKAASCTTGGNYDEVVYCSVCKTELSRVKKTVSALGHNYVDYVIAPTCTSKGYTRHKCSRCGDNYADTDVSPLGHDFAKWTVKTAATCTSKGTEEGVCTRCGKTMTRDIPVPGHNYVEYVSKPTCTAKGYTRHKCSRCGDNYVDTYVSALGHTPGESVRENEIPPTVTSEGSYDEVVYCSVCGAEIRREKKTVSAHAHEYVEAVTAPTCTEQGYTTHTCKACGEAYVDTYVDALGHDFGKGGSAEKCTRCGEKNPDYKLQMKFTDVPAGAFYAEAVAWAVENDITSGTSGTTFSPNDGCTRGQVVCFLWRAAGAPEPTGGNNPFKDVKSNAYYYKAVLWAVENHVTSGTSAVTFSPNAVCTRGQIVTFLWNANGMPEAETSANPFKDVKKTDYFFNAVLWAVGKGVTTGTDATHFSPSSTCTRGQVVTFLFRDMA